MDDVKDTNPKDAVGTGKVPLSLIPTAALVECSLAHLDGALKYGAWNWRRAGVRSSIYLDAAMRHLKAWQEGEERAPDSDAHHLGHAMACCAILLDALAIGNLVDDRPPSVSSGALLAEAAARVQSARVRYWDRAPRHYTIRDMPEEGG